MRKGDKVVLLPGVRRDDFGKRVVCTLMPQDMDWLKQVARSHGLSLEETASRVLSNALSLRAPHG